MRVVALISKYGKTYKYVQIRTETSVLTYHYSHLVLSTAISDTPVKTEVNVSDCWKTWSCVCL